MITNSLKIRNYLVRDHFYKVVTKNILLKTTAASWLKINF